jgi:hypothetical protein
VATTATETVAPLAPTGAVTSIVVPPVPTLIAVPWFLPKKTLGGCVEEKPVPVRRTRPLETPRIGVARASSDGSPAESTTTFLDLGRPCGTTFTVAVHVASPSSIRRRRT